MDLVPVRELDPTRQNKILHTTMKSEDPERHSQHPAEPNQHLFFFFKWETETLIGLKDSIPSAF